MTIRKAKEEELSEILNIYDYARHFMRQTGNLHQWIHGYPSRELLADDIAKGNLYVLENEKGLCGVFALIFGEDPTYAYIEGKWKQNGPYATIHRIAGNGQEKGILHAALTYAKSFMPQVRIDTHEDNKVMQKNLTKEGFQYAGIIYLENGDPRLAYEYIEG